MTAHASVSHADMANAIRFLAADAVEKAKSGHPGMPMGMADVATILFTRVLKFDPAAPDWPDRDRFVLSAGHGSMLLYAALHMAGYGGWERDTLERFRQLGSPAAGHPEYGHGAGIETTTGPLGQGIATAVGMALAEEMDRARFGDELVGHHTYVIAGDGCLMEGISQEAISLAGHLRLKRLIVLFDDNGITIDGATSLATSEDQILRFEASGWRALRVDGHDPEAVAEALLQARTADRPSLIACRTRIGRGAPTKEGTAKAHGSPLGMSEIAAAREALGWPYPPFEVPSFVREAWPAAGRRGADTRADWEGRLRQAQPDIRDAFLRHLQRELPGHWRDVVGEEKARASQGPAVATRKASGNVLDALTPVVPHLIGGSADLTGSVNTRSPAMSTVSASDFTGRYVCYGVREHAMAAVMNGMALHGGYRPYAGTFLVFADYMHPAMRLSALMGQPVIYVLTHDSIGLGEDGPTHQPVETLAMLRATPNLTVIRPGDPVETAEAWEIALDRTDGPTAIVLSRQDLPVLRRDADASNRSAFGGYVLAEADAGPRQVTVLATGSELSVAMAARMMLENNGIGTAVVSMPSFELFDAQATIYRDAVLGPRDGVRIAIEAAVSTGWHKYIGTDGVFVGMEGFGASGPAEQLFQHFGITAEAVVTLAQARLQEAASA